MLYDDLEPILSAWTDRTDVVDLKDTLIRMVEGEMTWLRTRHMVARAPLVVNQEYIDLPSDWLDERLTTLNGETLSYVSDDELQDSSFYSDNLLPPLYPTTYARVGGQLRFWPVPTEPQTVMLSYYQQITPLAEGVDNCVSLYAPNAYRFGVLWAAATFTKDEEDRLKYEALMRQALATYQAKNADNQGRRLRSDLPYTRNMIRFWL